MRVLSDFCIWTHLPFLTSILEGLTQLIGKSIPLVLLELCSSGY